MSLLALVLAVFAACLSMFTLCRIDRLDGDILRMIDDDVQEHSELVGALIHLRRDLQDAGVLEDPDAGLDVPTVNNPERKP